MATDTKLQDATTKETAETKELPKDNNVSENKDIAKNVTNVAPPTEKKKPLTLPALLSTDKIKARFTEMLEKSAPAFISSLLTLWRNNPKLQNCDPNSILGAAGLAASLHLSVSPSLGQAYIIPYKNQATFQIGVKGLVQLAHRSGKYTALNSGIVREGEIKGVDVITGDLIRGEKISDKVVGYVAFMRLVNGFEKALYMTKDEMEHHAKRYSQGYNYDLKERRQTSGWTTDFDGMAKKTVMKLLLNRWGVLSAELADAINGDQSIVTKNDFTYPDQFGEKVSRGNYVETTIDAETGEILENENNC
jgi:recombination protein RecT